MDFDIDFLPVGNGEKSGDAICLRWQEDSGGYKVMVIDGGTKESGEKLVKHIRKHYNTERVDYVVNTHPDQDHASGLSVVLEELEVGELWIHRPWLYTEQILSHFKDGRITADSLKKRLQNSFSYVYPLEEIAKEKKIQIKEPFQGEWIGIFQVLSPDKEWYLFDLLPNSSKTPEPKSKIMEALEGAKDSVLNWISETFDIETLPEDGETSADNESSVILYGVMNNKGYLFTGDAGIRAIKRAYNYNPQVSENLRFIQVPHHGSRRNVSPSVLDDILGKKGQEKNKTAFISASVNSPKHPRQSVVNAFIRRGCKVVATKGSTIHHFNGTSNRGWGAATPLEFKEEFEE